MFRATLMVFIQKTSPVTTTLIPYGSMFRCHCMANLYNKSWICKTYVRAILSGVRSHLFYSLMALLHVLQPFVQTQKCQKRHRLKDGEVGGVIKREMGNSFGNLRKYEPLERFSPSAVLWEALQHQLFSSSMCARAPRWSLLDMRLPSTHLQGFWFSTETERVGSLSYEQATQMGLWNFHWRTLDVVVNCTGF